MARAHKTDDAGGDSSGYEASSLQVLEGLAAVRKRPGMYIGSTDGRGLTHCVFEILDNSVDEALAGHCQNVTLTLHADGSASVDDDGRGIPVTIEPRSKLPGVVLVMTKLHAGGKFGGNGYKVSGGLHGVGASVVNALSVRVDVEVDRDGRTHRVSFKRGEAGTFDRDGAFTKGIRVQASGRLPKTRTGTRVRFWPDPQIFLPGSVIDADRIVERARQTAYLVPGLSITVRDERDGEVVEQHFQASGGLADMVADISADEPVSEILSFKGTGTYMETIPVLDDEGDLVSQDVEREMEVEVVLRWGKGYDYALRSFVNVVETPKGGTHVAGFERSLVRTVNASLANSRTLRANEEGPVKDDVLEGVTAIVAVKISEPQFEGQTKEILGTSAASGIVASVVSKELGAWLDHPRHKAKAKAVFEKVAEAARTRRMLREKRETIRRKSALESASMPDKLKDCRGNDPERTELFIIEGDSAAGTVARARDSEFQAYLPIRGKILNVLKANERKMLDNAECAALITALGAGSGRSFDLERVRYNKLILLADADVDGSHIRCLLLTLCWKYMRPLLEAGRVYSAMPPLYRVTVKGTGEHIYCYTDAHRDAVLQELRSSGKAWKDDIQRYKGLGEMDADQLAETTVDPLHRRLRRVQVADAESSAKLFEILMGDDAGERREFISTRSDGFDLTKLDV